MPKPIVILMVSIDDTNCTLLVRLCLLRLPVVVHIKFYLLSDASRNMPKIGHADKSIPAFISVSANPLSLVYFLDEIATHCISPYAIVVCVCVCAAFMDLRKTV